MWICLGVWVLCTNIGMDEAVTGCQCVFHSFFMYTHRCVCVCVCVCVHVCVHVHVCVYSVPAQDQWSKPREGVTGPHARMCLRESHMTLMTFQTFLECSFHYIHSLLDCLSS